MSGRIHHGARPYRNPHSTGVCARCGGTHRLVARRLCDACYWWASHHDALADYPRTRGRYTDAELVEEAALLRSAGNSLEQIAARLGLSAKRLRHRLRQASEAIGEK